MLGCYFYGIVLGLLIATLVDDRRNVNAFSAIVILPFFIVAGFFAKVKDITWPLKILSYLSALRFCL